MLGGRAKPNFSKKDSVKRGPGQELMVMDRNNLKRKEKSFLIPALEVKPDEKSNL